MEQFLNSKLLLIPISIVAMGILPLNSEFYLVVRVVVCLFGLAAFISLPTDYMTEKLIFLFLAILYNPIIPVYFGSRAIWLPINLLTIWFFWRLRNELKEYGK